MDLRCLVHGDNYATVGSLDSLAWMRAKLEGEFDMKTTIVDSTGADVIADGQILNRIIRQRAPVGSTSAVREMRKY